MFCGQDGNSFVINGKNLDIFFAYDPKVLSFLSQKVLTHNVYLNNRLQNQLCVLRHLHGIMTTVCILFVVFLRKNNLVILSLVYSGNGALWDDTNIYLSHQSFHTRHWRHQGIVPSFFFLRVVRDLKSKLINLKNN